MAEHCKSPYNDACLSLSAALPFPPVFGRTVRRPTPTTALLPADDAAELDDADKLDADIGVAVEFEGEDEDEESDGDEVLVGDHLENVVLTLRCSNCRCMAGQCSVDVPTFWLLRRRVGVVLKKSG